MLTTLAAIWASIKVALTSGILWKTILSAFTAKVMLIVTDKEVQKQAFIIAVSLNLREEKLSGLEKAKLFNEQMFAYLKERGLISTSGVINFLRELACQVISVKQEKGELDAEILALGLKKAE